VSGETGMRRRFLVVLLIAVFLCFQRTDLVKAETVYEESLTLNVGIYNTIKCSLFLELSVTTPKGPFDASEITSDPGFLFLYVYCLPSSGSAQESGGMPSYNITYRTDVQVYLNKTELSDTLHGFRMADTLKRNVEGLFSIFLTYVSGRSPNKILGADCYSFISNVSIVDQFWGIFKMYDFSGFSELFSSDINFGIQYMELRLEKIDGSYMWTYNIHFGFFNSTKIEFGQEYTLSLNEMLDRDEDISSATGASASNIYVDFSVEDANWTFVPLGIEPIMIKTQDDPQRIVFSTDIAGTRVTDVKIRFKILEKPENYLAMYVAVVVLGAFSCIVGSYLLKRRKIRSSRYRW
jgi:hypothetical protein